MDTTSYLLSIPVEILVMITSFLPKHYLYIFAHHVCSELKYILQSLTVNDHIGLSKICEMAALEGNLNVLQWARRNKYNWDSSICVRAAKNGHLEISG